jgi:hypothetical protein
MPGGETASLGGLELGTDRSGDGQGDFPLEIRQLAQLARIVFREQHGAVRSAQEAHLHPQGVAHPLKRALYDA